MSNLGTEVRPLRVAIVGAGPSGFYAADALLKSDYNTKISFFEHLPAPFGLVRYGVAPDHDKIKNVTKVYDKILANPDTLFFGNITIGEDLLLEELQMFFDAIILTYGAETDRKLGIPGEQLKGSYTATEFVAWYNGHPDFADREFDLSQKRVVIIGQGNVAMDVGRILCKTVDELKTSDIAQHALDALAESQVEEVIMVGRRGPAQAAFTPTELKEFGELEDCYPVVKKEDLDLNEASQKVIDDPQKSHKKKNYEILRGFLNLPKADRKRKFEIKFFSSPKAFEGKEKVERIVFETNKLVGEAGKQRSIGTGEFETLECGAVFRSVGYRGEPMQDLPFNEDWGTLNHQNGRVGDREVLNSGIYTAGWIKRGPSGVIGTNKPDAVETVESLLEDLEHLPHCPQPLDHALIKFLDQKKIKYFTYEDWQKIDAEEVKRGEAVGKPREKFVKVDEMLKVVGKE